MGYQSSFAELPRGVGSVSPQHKPLDDGFADFFDYSRYYDLPQHDMEEVASSSGRSSLPDLTSASSPAPSDNGSSSSSSSRGGPPSSPSLAPDGLWDRLNEVREHDDHLTIPKQTLYTQAPHHYPAILPAQHPFGGAPSDAYYHQATLATDFYLSPDSPDASSSSSFSPSSSSTTSSSSSPKQPRTGRGRRTKPLHNKDEVAEVRAMGACLHCRISKTRVCLCSPPSSCPYLSFGLGSRVLTPSLKVQRPSLLRQVYQECRQALLWGHHGPDVHPLSALQEPRRLRHHCR